MKLPASSPPDRAPPAASMELPALPPRRWTPPDVVWFLDPFTQSRGNWTLLFFSIQSLCETIKSIVFLHLFEQVKLLLPLKLIVFCSFQVKTSIRRFPSSYRYLNRGSSVFNCLAFGDFKGSEKSMDT
ncbi:hypothetical protein L1987_78267 [Smallanthus sonchifolius]|uniref:Uncharacterized protein n=1 Tax=Smallanthus sonchifolius TaxID=185202 RepID=A0ACB8ZB88_9ASTR|nr:hypothetical protein L1987_78267 [Smallanthus sonchifolius]